MRGTSTSSNGSEGYYCVLCNKHMPWAYVCEECGHRYQIFHGHGESRWRELYNQYHFNWTTSVAPRRSPTDRVPEAIQQIFGVSALLDPDLMVDEGL